MGTERDPSTPPPLPTEGGADGEGRAGRSQIRGSGVLLAGQTFSVLVNLVGQLLVVRYLSKSGYGAFAYTLSVVAIAQALAAFGLRHGVSRFMPMYEEQGEPAKAAGTLAFAIGMVLSLGAAVVLGAIALRDVISGGVGSDEAVALLTIMIALAPLFALGTVLDGVFAVFARPRAIVFRRFLLVPGLRLAVIGLLIGTGSGVVFLAWGYLAAELIGIAAYVPMLIPLLRKRGLLGHLHPRRLDLPVRRVLAFSGPLFTNDITSASLNAAGAIVVGALAGAAEVASLRAVFPLVLTMGYVLASFGTMFLPLASRLHARGETTELNRLYWHTATWTTLLAYPIFATAVILAEPVTVLLFGERYSSSAPILAVLALGQFVNTAAGHNGVMLGVFGRVRYIAATNAAVLAVNLGLTFALVPDHGALGAAIAITTSYLILNGARQYGLLRHTAISAMEPPYARALAAVAAVTGLALVIELTLEPPTAVGIAMTVAASACVYATVHRHLRLTETFPELARLPGVGALLGRRGPRG